MEAINTTYFTRNRFQTKRSKELKTSYEIVHKKHHHVGHFQIFRSRVSVYRPKEKRKDKIDTTAVTGIPVWYCRRYAYRVLLDEENLIISIRDAKLIQVRYTQSFYEKHKLH